MTDEIGSPNNVRGNETLRPTMSPVRNPAVPGQIRDMSELKVGEYFIRVHVNDQGVAKQEKPLPVLSEPFLEHGSMWIRSAYPNPIQGKPAIPTKLSLADMGIEPYVVKDKPNLWNSSNYTLRVDPQTSQPK